MDENPAGVEINGPLVRELRKLSGDDLVTFAPKAAITFQYLSQIELGVRPTVSPAVFVRICTALGIARRDRHRLIKSGEPDSVAAS